MSSVKNVSGNYDIYANLVTIHSDFRVIGNSATISTTNSTLKDNIIVLNDGETGAGVSLGNAGIMVNRGVSANAYWQFSETATSWEGRYSNGNLITIRAADPVNNSDVVTKGYLLGKGGSLAAGSDTQVQYNKSNNLAGNAGLIFTDTTGVLTIGNISIGPDAIQHTSDITVNSPLRMTNMAGLPTAVSNHTTVYANAPGGGGTGVYFVNTSNSDELISKTNATVLALIFS
jgi:hypothetical protein